MATTTNHRTTSPPPASSSSSAPSRIPAPGARRRPGLVALGVALAALGALATFWFVNAAGHRTRVLVVAQPVSVGSTLTQADLATAEVSADASVAVIPASQAGTVIGRVAATDLTTGALLTPGQVTDATPPSAGQVLVALSVPHARMPASGLSSGDRVLVVDTPAQDADPPVTPPSTIPATVVRVGSPDLNDVTTVDVSVVTGDGPALAARAATGRIALVIEPRTP